MSRRKKRKRPDEEKKRKELEKERVMRFYKKKRGCSAAVLSVEVRLRSDNASCLITAGGKSRLHISALIRETPSRTAKPENGHSIKSYHIIIVNSVAVPAGELCQRSKFKPGNPKNVCAWEMEP